MMFEAFGFTQGRPLQCRKPISATFGHRPVSSDRFLLCYPRSIDEHPTDSHPLQLFFGPSGFLASKSDIHSQPNACFSFVYEQENISDTVLGVWQSSDHMHPR